MKKIASLIVTVNLVLGMEQTKGTEGHAQRQRTCLPDKQVRQKKSKFKKKEHRTFIDWFIAVPVKITSSGHQIELKMCILSRFIGKHHLYKVDWEELDKLIEAA